MSEEKVRLNLGCNQHPVSGYVNVDIEPYEGVDVVTDLEKRWPWDDNSVDEVTCADLPEHLRVCWEEPNPGMLNEAMSASNAGDSNADVACLLQAIRNPVRHYGIIHFMNEAWRVLKPGGELKAMIPSTDAPRGWAQDPTHVSYWNENTIAYFLDTPQNWKGIYPNLIKCRWAKKKVETSVPNALGISYIRVWLEKLP